ncbi:MotA/TolQ/ExbB proton channel family protein [Cobetia crustatorum]|uniref:MotA/TolQ/ExbB proton channel family protein n=1 Tax=Cobetia crustatorum TaxID=553385 RepID=A0A558HX77_9GAMM|nr:MotA/TolQ/ExbB proton channel family protein [Cobetia crustatorum]TVU73740.1 MotA/TolQ/ExbB proton channel family protein [Cobetia crustatorum]
MLTTAKATLAPLQRLLLAAGLLGALSMAALPAYAVTGTTDQPLSVEQFEQAAGQAEGRDQQRLGTLLEDSAALKAAVTKAEAQRDTLREARQQLEADATQQQAVLKTLDREREAKQGDLGQVFKIARKHARETREALAGNWLLVGGQAQLPDLGPRDEVPGRERLAALTADMSSIARESGRALRFNAALAGTDGSIKPREIVRVGEQMAFSGDHLLAPLSEDKAVDVESALKGLGLTAKTPSMVRDQLAAFNAGDSDRLSFDPTGGDVTQALARAPGLVERLKQGGAVGYVIVGLGVLGLIIALIQLIRLALTRRAVKRQEANLAILRDDNPLGRVLQRFEGMRHDHEPEALEARLDEALLAEQPKLERGQALVKLLAAIAPLLGLLGTVTGMIGTFQSITVFGTGDPKLMAGGISQALVTTVLGLVTAVPLLFAQTGLSSLSKGLMGRLEGRTSAKLADHLEHRAPSVTVESTGSVHKRAAEHA